MSDTETLVLKLRKETPLRHMVELGRIYWGYPGPLRCKNTSIRIGSITTTFNLAGWMKTYQEHPDGVVDASSYEFEFTADAETLMVILLKYS